jgi:hypothetical protein
MLIRIAVPAARRKEPRGVVNLHSERIAKGSAMEAIVVPIRPDAIAPVIAGRSAYAPAIHARVIFDGIMSRDAM